MANQDQINKLLKQAVEAARSGNNNQARVLLDEITDLDEKNERAWYLLATLTDDPQEKRIYLENVLYANPHNERAQQMLNALDGRDKSTANKGVSSRARLYIGVALIIVFLIAEVALIGVGFNRRSNATATAVAFAATSTQQRIEIDDAAAQAATETSAAQQTAVREATAIIETQTATAGPSNTPTFDPTNLTSPPTWTPADLPNGGAGAAEGAGGEELLYPAPPAEVFAGQFIMAWGGFDDNNNGLFPLRRYDLDAGGVFSVIGDDGGGVDRLETNNVTVNPATGTHMVYVVELVDTTTALERATIRGRESQLVSDLWGTLERVLNTEQAHYALDGSKLVFIGESNTTNTKEIWMIDFDLPPTPNSVPLIQITADDTQYSSPIVSVDNSQIIAIQADPNNANEPDLVSIDIASGQITQLTQDGFGLAEQEATISPDGQTVVYVASEGNDPDAPADLIQLNLNSLSARPVIRTVDIDERNPVFSADGRYLAYASDESGVYNIYIRDLETGDTFQLSNETLDPVFPGSWYQPGVVPERPPLETLPTPVIVPVPGAES